MGKKVKHNAIINSSNVTINPVQTTEIPNATIQETAKTEIDNTLIIEVNELKDKLAKYIEENIELQNKVKELTSVNAELVDKSSKNQINVNTEPIDVLNNKIEELQQENDNYIMKISELSFENDKLRVECAELVQQIKNNNVQHENTSRPKRKTDMYPKAFNNGYTSWN